MMSFREFLGRYVATLVLASVSVLLGFVVGYIYVILSAILILVVGILVQFIQYRYNILQDLRGRIGRIKEDFVEITSRSMSNSPRGLGKGKISFCSDCVELYDHLRGKLDKRPKSSNSEIVRFCYELRWLMEYHRRVFAEPLSKNLTALTSQGQSEWNAFKTKYDNLANDFDKFLKDAKKEGIDHRVPDAPRLP
jgi:uncharacterized membrane protein YraQ (UPF0718 family)